MELDNIVFPVYTLGINRRLVLWLVGCPHACFGCSNPELWRANPAKEVALSKVKDLVTQIHQEQTIEGVTITGGEPFNQTTELAALILYLNKLGIKDIIVYTGFTYEALQARSEDATKTIFNNIALLIDGPYIAKQNDNRPLRGSSNQRLIFFRDEYKDAYEAYLKGERKMQLVGERTNIIAIGIPPKNYIKEVLRKERKHYANE